VLEVMQAGDKRIVVLTETHVALMRVRVAAVRSVYRAMWKVRLTKIQTVRGDAPVCCLSKTPLSGAFNRTIGMKCTPDELRHTG